MHTKMVVKYIAFALCTLHTSAKNEVKCENDIRGHHNIKVEFII